MSNENAENKQSTRDLIRQKTLGKKRSLRTTRKEVDGVEIDVRQPTVGERNEILDHIREPDGSFNQHKLLVWGVICLCYVPDTDERVFDDTDYDVMLSQPTDTWVDHLAETVMETMNVSEEEKGKD